MNTPDCIKKEASDKMAFISSILSKAAPIVMGGLKKMAPMAKGVSNAFIGEKATNLTVGAAKKFGIPAAKGIGNYVKKNPIQGTAMVFGGLNTVSDLHKNLFKDPPITNVPTVTNSEPAFTRNYFR